MRRRLPDASDSKSRGTTASRTDRPTARIFVVVSKPRTDLYEYFRAGLAGLDAVEVISDRRLEPDHPPVVAHAEQNGNRRRAPDIYDDLDRRGFVIVRLPT